MQRRQSLRDPKRRLRLGVSAGQVSEKRSSSWLRVATLLAMKRGVFCGLLCGLLGVTASCTLAEPYLIPSKAIELVATQPDDSRARAQVPALRQSDRAPVLIRYRALQWSDETLRRAAMTPMKLARVRAAKINPYLMLGGVILGLGVPHLALGMAAALDLPPGETKPADPIGSGVALGLGGLHFFVGGLLMVLGERNPNIEPTDAPLVEAYLRGEIPTATAAPDVVTPEGQPAPPAEPPRRSSYDVPLSSEESK